MDANSVGNIFIDKFYDLIIFCLFYLHCLYSTGLFQLSLMGLMFYVLLYDIEYVSSMFLSLLILILFLPMFYIKKCVSHLWSDDPFNMSNMNVADNMVPWMCRWITHHGNHLQTIDLQYNRLTAKGISLFFQSIKNLRYVKHVYLSYNLITDQCMDSIGMFIQDSSTLECLDLSLNFITDHGIKSIQPYLDGNKSLRNINLGYNDGISNLSASVLSQIIELSRIEELDVQGTRIMPTNIFIPPLIANIIKNSVRKSIRYSTRGIRDEDLIKICQFIKDYPNHELNEIVASNHRFTSNEITSMGASHLFQSLKQSKTIKVVNLYGNKLDDDCIEALGELLQNNQSIEYIDIGGSNNRGKITDDGIATLVPYVTGNINLKFLGLSIHKGITNKSIPYFEEMASKSSIETISFYGSHIDNELKQKLSDLLCVPSSEREIPVFSSSKSAAKSSYAWHNRYN